MRPLSSCGLSQRVVSPRFSCSGHWLGAAPSVMGGSLWAIKALITSLGGGNHCPSSLGQRPKQLAGREGSSHHTGGQSQTPARCWNLSKVWLGCWGKLDGRHPTCVTYLTRSSPVLSPRHYFTELETEAQQVAQARGRPRGDSHASRSGGLSYVSHHSASRAWLPPREGEPEEGARCEPLFLAQRPPDIMLPSPWALAR